MHPSRGLALSLLLASSGCTPAPEVAPADAATEVTFDKPDEAAAPVDAATPRATSCGGQRCAAAAGLSIGCDARHCVARSSEGAWYGDCAREGVYNVDLLTDGANCGQCGHACATSERCAGGICRVFCFGGTSYCPPEACVNVSSDAANCGACGRACAGGSACCDGRCVDVLTDPRRCGACGAVCAAGAACCGGRCVDPSSSRADCGACGRACGASERCDAGRCVGCEGGGAVCDDRCVDLARSAAHCGACGRACGTNERCVAGACAACPAGTRVCGESCVDVSSAPSHCGWCGNACAAGARCIAGQCANACGGGEDCAAGATCLEGYCVGPAPSPRAPLSTSVTTSARPWFRWRLPAGADGARVEVCATRGCERPVARWDGVGASLRAPTPLAPGVYFWRLFARRGSATLTTPSDVWEFVVPAPDAYRLPPRGLRVFSDFNGDGVADVVDTGCVAGADCGMWVHYGRAAGVTPPPDLLLPAPPRHTTIDGTLIVYTLLGVTLVGDIDRDGYGDFVAGLLETQYRPAMPWVEYGFARVYLGGASGVSLSFQRFDDRLLASGLAETVLMPIGDRNGDGYGDIGVWTFDTSRRPWYREFGGGAAPTFSGVAARDLNAPAANVLGVADFDADGSSDLVFQFSPSHPAVNVWGGTGRPGGVTLCRPESSAGGPDWVVLDANDDGFDDIDIRWGSERAQWIGDATGGSARRVCP